MRVILSIIRLILISVSFLLISFTPTTEFEMKMFFASRLVFFLMLSLDYTNVIYFNKKSERLIGILGLGFSIIFAIIDGAGVFGLVLLDEVNHVLFLHGNDNNFITQVLKPFEVGTYVRASLVFISSILGLEVLNNVIRGNISIKEKTNVEAA